jgi:hypothetical protein
MNRRQRWINAALIVLALAAFAGWAWFRWRRAPERGPLDGIVTVPMPEGGAVGWQGDNSPERTRGALAAAGAGMERALDEFFALSEQEQRKFLDRQIDMMQQVERSPAPRGPAGPRPVGPGATRSVRLSFSPQDHLDATTPERRAKEQEYFRRLRERRKERGIEDDGTVGIIVR